MANKNIINENTDSEKAVERHLVDSINSIGGACIKLLSDHFTGLPDRMCLLPGGHIVFVELKTTGKKPRKIQLYVHDKLRKLGFRVEVLDSIAGVMTFIKELKNERN